MEIWFTTLGMVVLDELDFPSDFRLKSATGVVGGSGTYGNRIPKNLDVVVFVARQTLFKRSYIL